MKKLTSILALAITLSASNAFASEQKLFCAVPRAFEYRDQVLSMRGTDKTFHCALSCVVALECSPFETYLLGLSKEIYDLFGGGVADQEDMVANERGIRLVTSGDAITENECMDQCYAIYPRK